MNNKCYHIPAVYWYGMFEGRPSLAMTYYSFSLETYICKDEFPREPKEPEKILCEIVKIMKSVHEAKVIHCDIKPANFMMKNDQIYLVDFGFCPRYMSMKMAKILPILMFNNSFLELLNI